MDVSGFNKFKVFKQAYGDTPLYKVIRDNMLDVIGLEDIKQYMYKKAHKHTDLFKCHQCGKVFSARHDKNRKYCSRRCFGIFHSQRALRRKNAV
jgi:protein-arginine kinase activator protein McsA